MELIGLATQEQIDNWKKEVAKKYGDNHKVYSYTADGRVCYLRSVDRETYAAAASKITTSPAKFNEVVINNIWLGGDETLKKEDRYYFGLVEFVEELMGKRKGQLGEC